LGPFNHFEWPPFFAVKTDGASFVPDLNRRKQTLRAEEPADLGNLHSLSLISTRPVPSNVVHLDPLRRGLIRHIATCGVACWAALKPQFARILDDFFPRYARILASQKYRESIEEIRVEGHTSTIWAVISSADVAYFRNMELSQGRTEACWSMCCDCRLFRPTKLG
jgi:hypothetical protein